MTFTHYYNVWATKMQHMYRYANFMKLMPYASFIRAWYCFLDLLDVDWERGMTCEKCGRNPSPVICDGTSLGFQKKFLSVVLEACPIEEIIIPRVR